MEESGNKGLGSAMQSDTSLHDSALKWWDDCEANTVPFNEGLSLSLSFSLASFSFHPTFTSPSKNRLLSCLHFPLFLVSSQLMG